jgi:hypothetical protein
MIEIFGYRLCNSRNMEASISPRFTVREAADFIRVHPDTIKRNRIMWTHEAQSRVSSGSPPASLRLRVKNILRACCRKPSHSLLFPTPFLTTSIA